MKRLFAINLWPYITDSHAFMSLFAASGLISAEFIIGESAIMPLLAHQETVEKVSFTPGYIQWTHLRALYGSRLDEKILAKVLPRINKCHSESFLREYNAANPEISIPNDFMNILLENCIRWGFADAHGTH